MFMDIHFPGVDKARGYTQMPLISLRSRRWWRERNRRRMRWREKRIESNMVALIVQVALPCSQMSHGTNILLSYPMKPRMRLLNL